MTLSLLYFLGAASLGCSGEPDLVSISGQVADSREQDAEAIPEVQVRTFDNVLYEVDSVVADGRGWFEAQVVANAAMYIEVSAPGYATAGFAGTGPAVGTALELGALRTTSDAAMEVIDEQFQDCSQDGALVEGEVRLSVQGFTPDDGQDWPLATSAWARAYDAQGNAYPACYLGESGFYDPEATATGPTGRFAVYGAPTGPVTLEVGFDVADQSSSQVFYIFVPEDGVVSLYAVYLYL